MRCALLGYHVALSGISEGLSRNVGTELPLNLPYIPEEHRSHLHYG
jgi:hypothetical protein